MEQTSSSNKIISLHFQECSSGSCPNSSVCYHLKKALVLSVTTRYFEPIRMSVLNHRYKIHESICNMSSMYYIRKMEDHPNYNITTSCLEIERYDGIEIKHIKDQIQVSVYNNEQVNRYLDFQKLFLIKDTESLVLAYDLMKKDTGRLHFLLDQKYVIEVGRQVLLSIIKSFQNRKDALQSLDTCFTSWIINGHCQYQAANYLDITYDGTARRCPYARKGIPMNGFDIETINEYMNVDINYHKINDPTFKCIYQQLFKGEMDEQAFKDINIQNKTSDNKSRSNIKRMRGFSLRR